MAGEVRKGMVEGAMAIGDRFDATVVNMRYVKPLDEALVLQLAGRHRAMITIEENALAGGAGSAVTELLAAEQYSLPLPSLAQLNLPLVGRVAAGAPMLAQEHIDQHYLMESSLFTRRPDYLLKVRGMSMRDAGIMDGDLLAVQKATDAKNGQIVVARLGDEVTVKRFKRTRSGIELIPENPDFETLHVAPDDASFALEGLAVGLIGLDQIPLERHDALAQPRPLLLLARELVSTRLDLRAEITLRCGRRTLRDQRRPLRRRGSGSRPVLAKGPLTWG